MESSQSLHHRGESGKSGLDINQILSIVGILASIFSSIIVYGIAAGVKKMRLKARQKKPDQEAGINIGAPELEAIGVSWTITNNFTGCSFHTAPTLPKPIVPAWHVTGSWPERGGNFPKPETSAATFERQFIWQSHSVTAQSDFNLLERPFLGSQAQTPDLS